jgi:CRP/FNR family cyclic AMP-dependent transcriptional regulator
MSTAQLRCDELASVDRIWHLKQSGLMEGLSLEDLNAVVSACKDRIYSRGEVIFDQGDPADTLYILNRGCVRISVSSPDDREKILGVYRVGILGENVLDSEESFQVRATAHEESWLSIISRDQLIFLIRKRSAIAINYVKLLSQRLLEARQDIESHSFLDTEHRLARILCKLASRHGKPVFGDGKRVKLRIAVSHEHLARMVGGNRPHVSMMMSKFKKRGWISYQGRKLVIKRGAMEDLISPANLGVPSS